MKRYDEIDMLKGIAVILMVIFHIFYFPNQYGFREIEYDTIPLKITARVAQIIFITCVGINLVFSYKSSEEKKEDTYEYTKKSIYRVLKLSFFALFMTLFTYFVFGEKYVKFGILHFIAFSSLVLFPFVNNMKVIYGILSVLILIYSLLKYNPQLFSSVPPNLAFISGFYFVYPAVDHFPLLPWMILICIGIIIGQYIVKNNPQLLSDKSKGNKILDFLRITGKKSLEVYVIHWLIIYLIFCHIYPKYIRTTPILTNDDFIIGH